MRKMVEDTTVVVFAMLNDMMNALFRACYNLPAGRENSIPGLASQKQSSESEDNDRYENAFAHVHVGDAMQYHMQTIGMWSLCRYCANAQLLHSARSQVNI